MRYFLAALAKAEAENTELREVADQLEQERDTALYLLDRPGD